MLVLLQSAAVIRMVLEKRASILEGALRRNPTSVKLRIAQLYLASQVQEHDVVDNMWLKAIKRLDAILESMGRCRLHAVPRRRGH